MTVCRTTTIVNRRKVSNWVEYNTYNGYYKQTTTATTKHQQLKQTANNKTSLILIKGDGFN